MNTSAIQADGEFVEAFFVLRVGAIGDVIHTLPLIQLLREKKPNSQIIYITSSELIPLLKYAKVIDEIIPLNLKSGIWNLIKQSLELKNQFSGKEIQEISTNSSLSTPTPLRGVSKGGIKTPFSEVVVFFGDVLHSKSSSTLINLQPSWKTDLLALVAGFQKVFKYKKKANTSTNISTEISSIHAWQNFAESLPGSFWDANFIKDFIPEKHLPLIELPDELIHQVKQKLNLNSDSLKIAIITGVGKHRPHRAWPLAKWIEFLNLLNRSLVESNKEKKIQCLFLGGRDEQELSQALLSECADLKNIEFLDLTGKLSLLETASILGQCKLAIGADTGPTHLASALGVETIALFGPTSEIRHAPLKGTVISAIKDKGFICHSKCSEKVCKLEESLNCMNQIATKEVLEKVLNYIHPSI